MTKYISFFSTTTNQGKRTLSQAFASVLAKNHYKVLYVELDYKHPAFAASTQISDATKNIREYLQNATLNSKFDPDPYIIKPNEFSNRMDKKIQIRINAIPQNLHFLTLPLNFDLSSFPTIVKENDKNGEQIATEFIKKMLYKIEGLNYDVVIFTLPNDIYSVFGLPIMFESNIIVNIVTPNPARLFEYQQMKKIITQTPINFSNWYTIINQTNKEINSSEYEDLIHEVNKAFLVHYDDTRSISELSLKMGAVEIDQQMEDFALELNFEIEQDQKKKRFIFSRG